MKKVVLIVFLVLGPVLQLDASPNTYLYNEVILKTPVDWLFLGGIWADNRENEKYLSLRLTPQKPLDLPWCKALDFGITFRGFKYQEWNEKKRQSEEQKKQFLELFLAPEIDFNWRSLNFRARNEIRIKWDGELQDNLFFTQIRFYPHRALQADLAYSTFDAKEMGGVRIAGISSELRLRVGTAFNKMLEAGLQFTSAYYRSQKEIWESEYRPDGGVYCRIMRLPFWLELSWERLKVKEKDRRINKILPCFTQDRVFVACGFSQDPKYVRR